MTIPGLTGVDHIGVTVPDLEQARQFFVEVLGCEFLYELGPKADPTGDWMQRTLNVDSRATIDQIYFFRCGNQAIFEVFKYSAPDQRTQWPRNCDLGGHHVALYVEDLDAAVDYLRGRPEVAVLGEPVVSSGHHLGQRWIYFLSPWGMQFELVSYPDGKAFFLQNAGTDDRASKMGSEYSRRNVVRQGAPSFFGDTPVGTPQPDYSTVAVDLGVTVLPFRTSHSGNSANENALSKMFPTLTFPTLTQRLPLHLSAIDCEGM